MLPSAIISAQTLLKINLQIRFVHQMAPSHTVMCSSMFQLFARNSAGCSGSELDMNLKIARILGLFQDALLDCVPEPCLEQPQASKCLSPSWTRQTIKMILVKTWSMLKIVSSSSDYLPVFIRNMHAREADFIQPLIMLSWNWTSTGSRWLLSLRMTQRIHVCWVSELHLPGLPRFYQITSSFYQ